MNVKNILKGAMPLCLLPNGRLVIYKRGCLSLIENENVIEEHTLFRTKKETRFWYPNIFIRLFRQGVRTAMAINEHSILLSVGSSLFEYDLSKRHKTDGVPFSKGVRPLIFTRIKNIKDFEDCVVFGGYRGNSNKEPVHIYKRKDTDKWEIVYTFESGLINHVHNIIADPYRNCLWIFTGDFDESAAIWKVTDNFKKVERILYNNQKFRGCVAFPVKDGLLYATDAPFAQNYIYLMKTDYNVLPLCQIDGSCIYGCQVGTNYVFSTTVEPDGRKNTLWRLFTYMKRGAGIKDMYVHMYAGNLEQGFKEIYKERKDYWPYAFQFGAFRFPVGVNNTNKLYFQPVATRENDLDLMMMEL